MPQSFAEEATRDYFIALIPTVMWVTRLYARICVQPRFISLLGAATVQAAEYYANFPQDTVRTKILVCRGGLLWIQQQLIIYTRLESSCEPASAPYQTLSN